MAYRASLSIAALAAFGLLAGPAAAEPAHVKLDDVRTIHGVEVGCTGIGQTKLDPKWKAFPVRVEFSNAKHEYLSDGQVRVTTADCQPVVEAACEGPWILLKLKPGAYKVDGWLKDQSVKPRNTAIKAPASGQIRVVLQFNDAVDPS